MNNKELAQAADELYNEISARIIRKEYAITEEEKTLFYASQSAFLTVNLLFDLLTQAELYRIR